MSNNAKLYDPSLLIQAGINPKTKLPHKMGDPSVIIKDNINKQLRIMDEQEACNTFKWEYIPMNLSSQEIERLLYYKGQLAFFYLEELNEFYLLPYALSGGLDAYGRFKAIHPIPITSGSKDPNVIKSEKSLADYLSTKVFEVLYDVVLPEDLVKDPDKYINRSCVLLHDYTKQMSETIIPRQILMDPLLDIMANCIPYMNTALQNSVGISGVKVQSEDESAQVMIASKSVQHGALTGEKWIPIQGGLDFQDLCTGTVTKPEEFLLAMQGLDNYRLSLHGITNGGLFQKKSHMLQSEQEMNAGSLNLVLADKLKNRQKFCDIVNSVWGVGIDCLPSEEIIQADFNGDGVLYTDGTDDNPGVTTESDGDNNVE